MPRKKVDEFLVWDGEGRDFDDGSHRLVLLANSDKEYIYNDNGLNTIQCIKFLLKSRPRKHNVWFSFGYDVCKILEEMPLFKNGKLDVENLQTLWRFNKTVYKGFRIEYIPRKFFHIYGSSKKEKFYSTDMFTFFQCSFIKACQQWDIVVPEVVIQGKKDRSIFNTYTKEQLLEYNFVELQLAKELITKLYHALKETNLVPRSWHGPGALAGTYFKNNELGKFWGKENAIPQMQIPIRHAYFGGRSDIAYIGEVEAYRYDIISAYPHALTDCISFENVGWFYQPFPFLDDRHALYHVRWEIPTNIQWGPFPWRKKNGTVLFPSSGEGWYWGIEVLAAEKLFPNCIKRIGAFYAWGAKRFPFKELIEKEYVKRNKVGRKTGAGIAIKYLLNSLYGKLCQSIGDPKWQNYIWAGFITATTRARMLDVIRQVGDENVVAIQTDGIFTKKRLFLSTKYKGELGSWESEGKATFLIVGAGLYTIFVNDKPIVMKARGMPPDLNHGWILREWGCYTAKNGLGKESFTSSFHSFIGIGKALHQNKPLGTWQEETRTLSDVTFGGTSKRVPTIHSFYDRFWHDMLLRIRQRPKDAPILSYPYKHNLEIEAEERIEEETLDA